MFDNRTISMFGAAVVAVVATFLLVSLVADQAVVGEPVGTTGAKEKPSGPDGPGDDDIDDLLGGEDDDEGDNGLWQANVGGTDFSSLDKENAGDVLFRGELTTQTFVDGDGKERSAEVCTEIPDIEMSREHRLDAPVDAPGSDSIELFLDFSTCIVSVASVTYGVVDEGAANEGEPSPQPGLPSGYNQQRTNLGAPDIDTANLHSSFGSRRLAPGTYALYRHWHAEQTSPQYRSSPVRDRFTDARVSARLKAADGFGFLLTESEIEMKYNMRTLDVDRYVTRCNASSPARLLGIRWHLDNCDEFDYWHASSSVRGYVEGDYHATIPSSQNVNDTDTSHSSSVSFKGYSDRYRATCRLESIDDILDELRVRLPLIGRVREFGVRFRCEDVASISWRLVWPD